MSIDINHKKLGSIRIKLVDGVPSYRRLLALPDPLPKPINYRVIQLPMCREVLAEILKEKNRV